MVQLGQLLLVRLGPRSADVTHRYTQLAGELGVGDDAKRRCNFRCYFWYRTFVCLYPKFMTFLFDWKVADIQTIRDLRIWHLPQHSNSFIGSDVLKGFKALPYRIRFKKSNLQVSIFSPSAALRKQFRVAPAVVNVKASTRC